MKKEIPSPLKAIRKHCLWCCLEQPKEVRFCEAINCAAYPLRMGRRVKGLNPLHVIKAHCAECSGNETARSCRLTSCALYPFRLGKNPSRVGIGNATPNQANLVQNSRTQDVIQERTCGQPVSGIGSSAFQSTSLTNVIIPNSIVRIGAQAFYQCRLISVTVPNSVTNIGRGAFAACTNLTAITADAPNSFYSSSDGVLFNANQTTLCTYPAGKAGPLGNIPTNVTSIGDSAFWGCTKLTSVPIPNSVTNIENYAFMGCLGLTNAAIPARVISIKSAPFIACTRLSEITVDSSNHFYCSVDGVLFDKNQTILIQYPAAKTGSCYSIPTNVVSIGDSAFHTCTNMTSVVIPSSVASIGYNTFYDCVLTSITIPSNVTNIGHQAFLNCSKLQNVYFEGDAPSIYSSAFNNATNVAIYYSPTASGWTEALAGRPTVLWNPKIQTGDAGFGVRFNRFGFTVTGTTNIPIAVEACTNLFGGTWISLQTNRLTNGTFDFTDSDWTNYPGRFYRVSFPQ